MNSRAVARVSNNTICPNAVWPPEAQAIINESGLEAAYQNIVPADWKPFEETAK